MERAIITKLCYFIALPFLTSGHVALTYPPARSFDLDFLDNARTPAPCGMPKGDVRTSLIQGSTVNVTWHLAYPHQGGYYLELLDSSEQHMTFLTTGGRFIANDTTAQNYALKLPNDLVCRNCTLRLVRQASEWGRNYRFWSCADVDILPRAQVTRTCSGKGRFFANRCLCNKRFYGKECQYENECEEDEDCNPRFGKCINVDATTYPKKQCFCARGYFGPKCSKSSHIKSETQVNFGLYSHRNLSDSFTLYWRVLHEEGELEVVMVNKGTSYAAVGWRPVDATATCQQLPKIEGSPPKNFISIEPEPALALISASEPEPEPKAESEPEPNTESEPVPKAESEPEPNAESEPEPNAESEPEPNAESEPEPQPKSGSDTRDRATLAFPSSLFTRPKSTTTEKPEDTTENGPPMSLADRLAKFSGRKKRSPQNDQAPFFASPLLKPAKSTQLNPKPVQETKAEGEPEPVSEGEPEPEPKNEGAPEPQVEGEPEPQAEGEPEPKPEGEPEPKAEGEPYPKAEGEPEPKAEGEPEPQAEGEPEPQAEGEPEPQAEGEPEPQAEGEPEPEPESTATSSRGGSYYPRGSTLHAMDCTDIVIGVARGSFYRVSDYYTRDRSTPRVDEFWGGESSLTAAFGWEKDGETTILFRKKLTATHFTDQSITDSLMHIIWARGQEPNLYVHSPRSGLEVGNPSVPNFYRPDEVKYHGKDRNQRGVASLNFYESISNLEQAGAGESINWCGGLWKYPHSCSREEGNCEYFARWEFEEATDNIYFTVSTSNSKLWTGIGFSDDTSMRKTDVVLGWMTPTGKYFMYDGWLQSYTFPTVDNKQDISNMSASQQDGITTLNFSRKRQSNDHKDLSFTNTKCLYLVFPVKGGHVNTVNKRIKKHQLTPTISSQRICIRSCSKFGGADGKPIVFTTTPRPPELVYNVEFKITNAGENMVIPTPGSPAYNTLVNQILTSAEGAFQKIPGFVVADINDLDGSDPNTVKVNTRVTLNKEMHEEKFGEINTEEDQQEVNTRVRDLVNESIKTGRMGQLSVEPSFLTVNYLKVNELSEVTEDQEIEAMEPTTALAFIDKHKFWFIGAGIVALIVLALLQGIITSCRKKRNQPPPVSTKERLITNSRWRDYSRGATNYAYETYEPEAEPEARRIPSLRTESGMPYKNGGRIVGNSTNGHINGGIPSSKDMSLGYGESRAPPGAYDHTRSLQRPKHIHSSVISDPRTTYSLPRGSSATSSPPPYSSAMQDLTPDFYYLPSQRKYSGEVVRVYVDYNQPK